MADYTPWERALIEETTEALSERCRNQYVFNLVYACDRGKGHIGKCFDETTGTLWWGANGPYDDPGDAIDG
jgi:hypothetical protein